MNGDWSNGGANLNSSISKVGFPCRQLERARRQGVQFLLLSTSARCLTQVVVARSLAPPASIGWAAHLARMPLNEVWLTRFSRIQSLTNLPDWMSARICFISALVSGVTTRGPETYSPYSAV